MKLTVFFTQLSSHWNRRIPGYVKSWLVEFRGRPLHGHRQDLSTHLHQTTSDGLRLGVRWLVRWFAGLPSVRSALFVGLASIGSCYLLILQIHSWKSGPIPSRGMTDDEGYER